MIKICYSLFNLTLHFLFSVTSIISKETRSNIKQYLGSPISAKASFLQKPRTHAGTRKSSTSSKAEVRKNVLSLQDGAGACLVDSQGVHLPSGKFKEVIITEGQHGEPIELQVTLNSDQSQDMEYVVEGAGDENEAGVGVVQEVVVMSGEDMVGVKFPDFQRLGGGGRGGGSLPLLSS